MSKIKILHIIKSLGRGGAEMLLPETIKIHDKEIFEFHVIYFLPWKDQLVQPLNEAGAKVTCMKARNNFQLILQYKRIIDYSRENSINLIHCHLPWAGFVGRLVHKKTNIPILYTEHNLQERYHVITRILNKWSFNFQTLALGVSNDVTESIIKKIIPETPVKTLLNGVNTFNFIKNSRNQSKKALGIPSESLVIGNVAVFRFQKRLVEWLQVLFQIRQKNSSVYGIIVGAGPLEEEIKKELYRLNLQDHVILPGLQTDVKPFMEAMDIFMMTSQFEGLPIALLEAMSMECAIVSTNAGGIKEVIRNEVDGLTCEVENWSKLSDLCLSLIQDQGKLENFKKAARARVVQSFSLEKMVFQLEQHYRSYT